MPLTETRPDALAQVYARSLFELAEERGGQQAIEDTLAELEDILELARHDADFSEFLASRVLGSEKRDESLVRIFQGRVSDLTMRFLRLLNSKDRLSHLPPIAAAYDALVQERFGRIEVDVYTASPLSPDELRAVKDRLQTRLGKEVIVHPYTDGSMLGGIRFRIGDQLVDASVSARLRKLRDQLHRRGAASLRARAADVIQDTGSPDGAA